MVADTESHDVDLLEQCAYRVLSSIEKTISTLKSVEAFSPNTRKRPPLQQVDLVGFFDSQGIFQHVEETIAYVQDKLMEGVTEWISPDKIFAGLNIHDNQRATVVRLILFPLLDALSVCYRHIDSVPQQSHQQLLPKKYETKPPPPQGMLSLQNYTDVGAFLEFTVCTSLLPCLEANILTPIKERAQYLLPKSLAGRLPRVSLLWASAVCGEDGVLIPNEISHVVRTIASVVLLDRFRPMLLPRHLADLYAGIFQGEILHPSDQIDPKLSFVYSSLLPVGRGDTLGAVDSINQARALQTLLLRGTLGPSWLRKRVSSILTDLATQDLFAIIQVFVVSASSSQADRTSAALRLAKTLVAVNEERDYSLLCHELVRLLDVDVETLNSTQFSCALLFWAFLDQLMRKQAIKYMLPLLSRGIFPNAPSQDAHRMVRRLLVLFAVIPASHSAASTCELILSPLPTTPTTLLSQLVRLATFTSIDDECVKSDATIALRMFCSLMERSHFCFSREKVDGVGLLCVSLINAVAPKKWDACGFQYHVAPTSPSEIGNNNLTLVTARCCEVDNDFILDNVRNRASFILTLITGAKDSKLPNCFFQYLLATIFCISQKNRTLCYPGDLGLTVLILMPMLCEAFSADVLLLGKSSDASGILSIINLFLDCAASVVDDSFAHSGASELLDRVDSTWNLAFHLAPDSEQDTILPGIETMDDVLLSTTSITLSLLIAMLELGSESRTSQEFTLLEVMIPSLRVLSSSPSKLCSQNREIVKLQAEVAEMASHAAVLIVSRKVILDQEDMMPQPPNLSVASYIAKAESELRSEHPALRAHGVAMLRHLARGYLVERGDRLPTKPMIVDMTLSLTDQVDILHELLRLSILTLSDSESYVYLAGIQTVVAIADMDPGEIVPLLGHGVCTGEVDLKMGRSVVLKLTQDDRIKLAEALLFVVRRRGPVIENYMDTIITMMIHGHQQIEATKVSQNATFIQEATHNFFWSDSEDANELTSSSDRLDSRLIRAKTGGPIFMTELNDVLRCSCLQVIVEVVDAAQPSSIAAHAFSLVQLVHNILSLEHSRPLRRAAASLAVALYETSLREIHKSLHMWTFTLALVSADEGRMKYALEAGIDPNRSCSSQLYDPATSARCQEALHSRCQVEESGAFKIVALHVNVQKREAADPVVSFVKRRLQEGRNDGAQLMIPGRGFDS